ncbi:MAG: Type 1 glutamine amidotransferase-like domain-containing protein, partial [Myxococcales bacterium]|nr:Type 1 glutamine amidotransferase-like domain-containing protein [Myxococcales bacterium]
TRDARPGALVRHALRGELGHAIATLEENDERMMALLADLEARCFDATGLAYQPAWRAARARLEARVVEAGAIFLFGGGLAPLLEALRFFRLRDAFAEALRRGALFVAMSAGAMSLCERVIVYDDFAAEPRDFQLFDRGLGIVRDLQLFPHCMDRIQTDDPDNLAYLAHRFRHHVCVGLNQRSFLRLETSPRRAHSVGSEDAVYVFDPSGRKIAVPAGAEVPL